jgi:hypothetical protein
MSEHFFFIGEVKWRFLSPFGERWYPPLEIYQGSNEQQSPPVLGKTKNI